MIIKYNKNIISKLNKRIFSGNDLLIIGVLGNEDNLSKIEIEDKLNNCISRNTMIRCLKQLTDVNILVRFKKGKVYKYSLNKKYKRGQVLIPYSLFEDCINKKTSKSIYCFCCYIIYLQKYIKWFNNYTQQDISYKYNMGLSITNKYLQEIIKKGYLSKEDIPTNKCYPRDYILKNNSEIIPYWSKNNALKIDEITPFSLKKYKWICEDCGCEFEREIGAIIRNNSGVHCRPCGSSKGEYKIKQWLDKNNIEYITQKTFDNLIGMGRGLLSYDFYLPQYNLLIEFQGEQHERFIKGFHIDKKGFKKQQEHDRRKKEYARKHNIKLLEIWYYDESNIGDILKIY